MRLQAQPGPDDLLAIDRFVDEAAVIGIAAFGAQQIGLHITGFAEAPAAVERDRGIAVRIVVRLVGEAARARRGAAAAGVEAVGIGVGEVGRKPALLAVEAHTGGRFAGVVAADGGAEVRAPALAVAAAREDLDHAADRFRTVQARARAADHFDAFDLVDRQILEGDAAGCRGADAHAVDEHEQVVGFGAAQEQRCLLAGAAVARGRYAGQPAQQIEQRARLQALDVLACDYADRGEAVVDSHGSARRGDDHVVEFSDMRSGFGAQDGAGQGQERGNGPRKVSYGA